MGAIGDWPRGEKMAQVHNIKCFYAYGGISSSSSRYCKITKLNQTSWQYSFEDARHWYQKWDYQEPLLRVEELRDPTGQLTHLRFVIDNWDGSQLARIVIGANELAIIEITELESPPAKNIGLSRVLWIDQIEELYLTIPKLPALSWWQKLPTFGKVAVIEALTVVGLVIFWKVKK